VSDALKGTPQAALKEQFSRWRKGAPIWSPLLLADPKLAALGIVPAADQEAIVRAEYEAFARTALVQLRRIRQGTQIEEDHMRNRQMIVRWLMANTKAIEERTRDGKTYLVAVDPKRFARLRPAPGRGCSGSRPRAITPPRRAVRRLRRALRSKARDQVVARVDRLKPAVLHRLRDAEAHAC